MDLFERLGNFISGKGFNNNSQLEEEKRRREAESRPTPAPTKTKTVAPQPILSVGVANTPTILGVSGATPTEKTVTEPNLFQQMGSGIQQSLGHAADTAIQGAGVFKTIGDIINPLTWFDDKQREANITKTAVESENLRHAIFDGSLKDFSGNAIIGNRDLEDVAARVASGQGSPEDFAALVGRGLDVGLTETSLVNPTKVAVEQAMAETAGKSLPTVLKALAPSAVKEGVLFGGLGGAQTSAETYAETGDIRKAAESFLPSAIFGGTLQTGMNLAGATVGHYIGRARAGLANTVDEAKVKLDSAVAQEKKAEAASAQVPKTVEIAPGVESTNIPKVAKTQAEQQVAQAKTVTEQVKAEAEQVIGAVAKIDKDIDFAEKTVKAAQERLDYLIREGRPTKQAKLELRKAEGELANVKKSNVAPPKEAVPDQAHTEAEPVAPTKKIVDKTVGEKNVLSEDGKVTTPGRKFIAGEPATKTVSEVKLTKSGETNKRWFKSEIDKVMADDTILDKPKAIKAIEARITKAKLKVAKPAKTVRPLKTKKVAIGELPLSGEKKLSKGHAAPGTEYDATSRAVNERQGKAGATKAKESKFIEGLYEKSVYTVDDRNTASQLQKRYEPGSIIHNLLSKVKSEVNTTAAQILATAERLRRELSSANELTSHYVDKIVKNGVNLNEDDLAELTAKNKSFIKARSELNEAMESFESNPSGDALKRVEDAKNAKMVADKEALVAELTTLANKSKKEGATSDLKAVLNELSKNTGVYQMDYVDMNMLSSTGTHTANLANSLFGSLEETLFGKLGATVANKTVGTKIGSGSGFNFNAQKAGFGELVEDVKLRNQLPGNKVLNKIKNIITTMNELGNTQLVAQSTHATEAEYRNIIKAANPNMPTEQLDVMAKYNSIIDPQDLKQKYLDSAFAIQGMGGKGLFGSSNLERSLANNISLILQGKGDIKGLPKSAADTISKLSVRITLGFPSVMARSAMQGTKRGLLGSVSLLQAIATKDPQAKAFLIKKAVKEFGSGATFYAAGAAAGASGLVTGAYPSDKATREKWQEEGISENSIKIGEDYIQLPRVLGAFALPFMVGANFGKNAADGKDLGENLAETATGVVSSLAQLMPVADISNNLSTIVDMMEGKASAIKGAENMSASTIRSLLPVGAFQNQVAQSLLENKKDTTSDDFVTAVLSKVLVGVPFAANAVGMEDATSKDGTVIKNTNPVARAFGAVSSENTNVVESNKQEIKTSTNKLSPVLGDDKFRNLLSDEDKKIYDQASKDSSKLLPKDLDNIRSAVIKGAQKFMEDSDYDAYKITQQLALDKLNEDPTSTSSAKKKIEYNIKLSSSLKKNNVEYDLYRMYAKSSAADGADTEDGTQSGISQSELKKMLNPDSDYYNPSMAGRLVDLDKKLAADGVSGNSLDSTMPKYDLKAIQKSLSSGSGFSKKMATDIGTISSSLKTAMTPTLKAESLKPYNSTIPNLAAQTAKTNLKRSITVTKGVRL